MASGRSYPQELRERGMRMVVEARAEDPGLSVHQAVLRIGPRVGIVLEKNRELERANEILLAASSFFARELD